MKLIAVSGSLILLRAKRSGVMPMESNALLMSWKATHSSLLLDLASSIALCKIWIGVFVVPPGNPPKFGPRRMLCFMHRFASLVLMTLMISFLRHSNRMIGLVRFRQKCQSYGFGMGKICDVFHSTGMKAVR